MTRQALALVPPEIVFLFPCAIVERLSWRCRMDRRSRFEAKYEAGIFRNKRCRLS